MHNAVFCFMQHNPLKKYVSRPQLSPFLGVNAEATYKKGERERGLKIKLTTGCILKHHLNTIESSNYFPRTADYLSPLWSNADHWPYAPGVCNVTGKSGRILHSWLIKYFLWDSSRDLHSRIPVRSGSLLSDLNDQTFYTISHLNHPGTDVIILTSTCPQIWTICSGVINLFKEWKQQWDTSTYVSQIICPEGHVSSLNKCNPPLWISLTTQGLPAFLSGFDIHTLRKWFSPPHLWHFLPRAGHDGYLAKCPLFSTSITFLPAEFTIDPNPSLFLRGLYMWNFVYTMSTLNTCRSNWSTQIHVTHQCLKLFLLLSDCQ